MQENGQPFKKVAFTSYLSGGLATLLGVLLLLASKSDVHSRLWEWGIEKIVVGIGLIVVGVRWLQMGFQQEAAFTLKNVYDPEHNRTVARLLDKRDIYRMFKEKSFSLHWFEKADVSKWQLIFYSLISKKGIARVFDYLPYPIGNFIARQSRPVVLFSAIFVLFLGLIFLSYLDVLPFAATIADVNVLLLLLLLFLWRPARIQDVFFKDTSRDPRGNTIVIVVIAFIAYMIYRRLAEGIHVGIFLTLVLMALAMIWISFVSIRLIGVEYASRPNVSIHVSEGMSHMQTVHKQPEVIFKQFENILSNNGGWQDMDILQHRNPLEKVREEKHPGSTFALTRIYETPAKLQPLQQDEQTRRSLDLAWMVGNVLVALGLCVFFLGFLVAGQMLASLYCLLTGTAFFFLGNKLVYEIYLFFQTEAWFESNLIFFNIEGSYGEYEQVTMANTTKRKDIYTDFTPEIKVCTIISHVFIHPYLGKDELQKLPRFIVRIDRNDSLYTSLTRAFEEHMDRLRPELPPSVQ